MRYRWIPLAPMTFVMVLASCQPKVGPLSEADESAIRERLQANNEAGIAGDWDTFFSVFAEDAVLMLPNVPTAEGMNAIREIPWVRALESEPVVAEIKGLGDLAIVRGTYTLLLDFEGATRDRGAFMQVWRKQADGSWLMTDWIYKSDLPLPPAEGEHSEGEDHT